MWGSYPSGQPIAVPQDVAMQGSMMVTPVPGEDPRYAAGPGYSMYGGAGQYAPGVVVEQEAYVVAPATMPAVQPQPKEREASWFGWLFGEEPGGQPIVQQQVAGSVAEVSTTYVSGSQYTGGDLSSHYQDSGSRRTVITDSIVYEQDNRAFWSDLDRRCDGQVVVSSSVASVPQQEQARQLELIEREEQARQLQLQRLQQEQARQMELLGREEQLRQLEVIEREEQARQLVLQQEQQRQLELIEREEQARQLQLQQEQARQLDLIEREELARQQMLQQEQRRRAEAIEQEERLRRQALQEERLRLGQQVVRVVEGAGGATAMMPTQQLSTERGREIRQALLAEEGQTNILEQTVYEQIQVQQELSAEGQLRRNQELMGFAPAGPAPGQYQEERLQQERLRQEQAALEAHASAAQKEQQRQLRKIQHEEQMRQEALRREMESTGGSMRQQVLPPQVAAAGAGPKPAFDIDHTKHVGVRKFLNADVKRDPRKRQSGAVNRSLTPPREALRPDQGGDLDDCRRSNPVWDNPSGRSITPGRREVTAAEIKKAPPGGAFVANPQVVTISSTPGSSVAMTATFGGSTTFGVGGASATFGAAGASASFTSGSGTPRAGVGALQVLPPVAAPGGPYVLR